MTSVGEVLISIFIVVFCCLDLIVCSPPSPLRDAWFDAVHPALDYVTLCTRFNMFSPVPPKQNYLLEADITFANGKTKTWNFPTQQSYKNDFWLPQVKVRYQYWESYVGRGEQFPLALPGAAVYAARCNFNPVNPPTHVRIYRIVTPIELPGAQKTGATKERIYDCTISPSDLT